MTHICPICGEHFCSEHFDKWWNSDAFDWRFSWMLAKYCHKQFDKWWDTDKYDWYSSGALCSFCSEYFNIWWDEEKFDWENASDDLCKYCHDYIDKCHMFRLSAVM